MRKARLGDVYYIKVPNGYKLYQWAYTIPRRGDYIRVFNGLYPMIPNNVEDIVLSPHSYIIAFYAARAYRKGISHFLKNLPIPSTFPFPKYQLRFSLNIKDQKVDRIHVMNSDGGRDVWQWFDVGTIDELPEEYRDVTLLNSCVTPNWLLYLFDNGFDLKHPERFFLGANPEVELQKYNDLINMNDS